MSEGFRIFKPAADRSGVVQIAKYDSLADALRELQRLTDSGEAPGAYIQHPIAACVDTRSRKKPLRRTSSSWADMHRARNRANKRLKGGAS